MATPSKTHKLELRTANGPVWRDVLSIPPRDCTPDEIPVIDISRIFSSSLADRKSVAQEIKLASVNTGFFYIKNHTISDQVIENARSQLLTFFHQPLPEKLKLDAKQNSRFFNGYSPPRTTTINRGERTDTRESLGWRYSTHYDPDNPRPISAIPKPARPWIRGEEFIWEKTSHLPNFKRDCLAYWGACLSLARKLVCSFALALDLEEDYFDSRTSWPGADGVLNYYPPASKEDLEDDAVGLGSHTDLQLFTLLWQDHNGGLQVLNREGQWIRAPPREGTFVVNIGDFLMRLSNDLFKSTVHRVYNRSGKERVSMPFFFGLNFDCVEGVIPSCVRKGEVARYEPMSCGQWCQLRFEQEQKEREKRKMEVGAGLGAPGAAVVQVDA